MTLLLKASSLSDVNAKPNADAKERDTPSLLRLLFPTVKTTLEQCQINHRVTYAIVYECVIFIGVALKILEVHEGSGAGSSNGSSIDAAVDPVLNQAFRAGMKEAALGCVAKFLESSSTDVKFVGLKVK